MGIVRWLLISLLGFGGGFAQAAVTPWVDFDIVNGLVVIPTEIQGIKGHSVIDTGAQFTGIAEHFVKEHNLDFPRLKPMKVMGVNGTDLRKTYRDVPVTLMGAELTFKQVIDLDLGPRPQLLIGGDFLRTLYFQFDYPNKRLRAISREAFDLKKVSNVQSKLDPVSRQPMAKVRLNDEYDAWFVIDTGNTTGVLMKRRAAKKRKWLEKFSAEQTTVRGITATAGAETFRMPLIAIGPYNVRNARVIVPLEGVRLDMFKRSWTDSGRLQKTQGLLGYDVLKNFLVTFDYRSGAIFVELPEAVEPKAAEPAAAEPMGE